MIRFSRSVDMAALASLPRLSKAISGGTLQSLCTASLAAAYGTEQQAKGQQIEV